MNVVEDWVIALVGSPWVYVALFVFVTVDGFFPPMPSESAVIALAALAVATGQPDLWVLVAVASLAAFTGDQIAYSIGRRIPARRLPFMQGRQAERTLRWAENALTERGAAFIIAARYIPVGRVAVNMTAGTVHFSRRRFSGLAGFAAVMWGVYAVALGVGAGAWFADNPVLAVVVGVVAGFTIGVVIDAAMKRAARARPGTAGRPAEAPPAMAQPGTDPV